MPKKVNIKFYIIIGLLVFVIIYFSSFSLIESLTTNNSKPPAPTIKPPEKMYYVDIKTKKVKEVKETYDVPSSTFYYLDKTKVDSSGNFFVQEMKLPYEIKNYKDILEVSISNSKKPNSNYSIAVSRLFLNKRLSVNNTKDKPLKFRDKEADEILERNGLIKVGLSFERISDLDIELNEKQKKWSINFLFGKDRHVDGPGNIKYLIYPIAENEYRKEEFRTDGPGSMYTYSVDENVFMGWTLVSYDKQNKTYKYYIVTDFKKDDCGFYTERTEVDDPTLPTDD